MVICHSNSQYYVTAKGAVTAIRFWRSKHEKCNRHTGRIFTLEGKLIARYDLVASRISASRGRYQCLATQHDGRGACVCGLVSSFPPPYLKWCVGNESIYRSFVPCLAGRGSLEFKEKCSLIRKGEWITQAFHEPIELEPGMF